MKAWLITLPLLFVFNVSVAAEEGTGMGATETGAASAQEAVQVSKHKKRSGHRARHRRLPTGDLRHCLELKDNAEIIKCAETRR
jgi:hypothetical protein